MSLGDHLEELRWRILKAMIGPLIIALVMIYFAPRVVDIICQPLLYELARRGLSPTLVAHDVGTGFNVYLRVCILGGVVIGIPWIIWQMWLFIAPGLHKHERRFVVLLLPGSAVLAVLGVLFMYYFILPLSMWFFLGMMQVFDMPQLHPTWVQEHLIEGGKSDEHPKINTDDTQQPPVDVSLQVPVLEQDPVKPINGQVWLNAHEHSMKAMVGDQVMVFRFTPTSIVDPMIEMGEYIGYVLWMGLSFAVVFQLPLIMLLGGWVGLLDRKMLSKGRKYVVLLAFIVSAVITPGGSAIAQTLTALPMYLLYELGLLLMRLFVKRKATLWSDWDDAGAE